MGNYADQISSNRPTVKLCFTVGKSVAEAVFYGIKKENHSLLVRLQLPPSLARPLRTLRLHNGEN
jgi:hypothetical protein